MKKVINIIQSIEIIILVIISILCLGCRIIGFTPFVVETGSMQPTIPTYSVAYVKSVNADSIVCDDIIAFNIESKIVTHRVIDVNKNENYFTTKGDANSSPDPLPVKYDQCVGIVKYHIPYLGYVLQWIKTTSGIIVLGGILAMNIVLDVIFNLSKKKKNNK